MSDLPTSQTLPCGCYIRVEMEGGERTMKVVPCKFGCSNAIDLLIAASDHGANIEFREAP